MQVRSLFFHILLLLLLGFPTFSSANEQRKALFTESFVTTSDSHLIYFGSLVNSFNEEMVEGVKSGIPIEFSFYVLLQKVQPNWPDKDMVKLEFKHTLTYDTLKESFNIELEEKRHRVITSELLSETQKIMSEINGLEIAPLKDLTVDGTYKLKVRAVLNKKTLPMGLHKVTPFISWWDQETDWHEITFTY